MVIHPIPPVYNTDSRLLILGSFPSVKSREKGFFYGHPQNRFWRVLASIYNETPPSTVAEKKAFLLKNKVAVWDVISRCDIVGSADSSIKNVVPNDLTPLLQAGITRIYTNGGTAKRLYDRYLLPQTGITAYCLPSTSPANAAWSLERLVDAWKIINRD